MPLAPSRVQKPPPYTVVFWVPEPLPKGPQWLAGPRLVRLLLLLTDSFSSKVPTTLNPGVIYYLRSPTRVISIFPAEKVDSKDKLCAPTTPHVEQTSPSGFGQINRFGP